MKTPTLIRSILVLSVTAAGLVVFSWARPSAPARPPANVESISVASFEQRLPVGHLGVPLGTVVRVTGEAFDGSTTGAKADDGKTLLRVMTVNGKKLATLMTVNGKKLATPVVFEFLRAPRSVKKPAPGDRFDYYVHEYGEFDGVVTPPEKLGIETIPVANDGFYYRRRLTVHAANAVRK